MCCLYFNGNKVNCIVQLMGLFTQQKIKEVLEGKYFDAIDMVAPPIGAAIVVSRTLSSDRDLIYLLYKNAYNYARHSSSRLTNMIYGTVMNSPNAQMLRYFHKRT